MSDASVSVIDGRAVVRVGGSELLAPIVKTATDAMAATAANVIAANLAAATALASSRYFATRAAGESASTVNQLFSTDDGAGSLIFYRRTSGGSFEVGRALTPAYLSADGGASLVGTKLTDLGERRDQQDKNGDTVDVWDFMTPAMKASVIFGNLAVDTAPAFQKALDWASGKRLNSSGHGRRVTFRGGTYRWDTPVAFDWRATQAVVDAGDMRRPTLEGDGSSNSVIFYTGASETPALTLAGYSSGANGGVDLFLTLRGFWLRRSFGALQTGTGIKLNQSSFIHLEDVGIDQFALNLDVIDTIRLHAFKCRFTGALEAVYARVGIYSHPNVFVFDRCDFGGNFKRVARFTTPANIVFQDCGIEGNGDGTDHLVQVNGGPQEGGCGLEIRGGYIENNFALSEVFVNWSAANNNGVVKLSGVTFSKTSNARTVANHILISAEPPSAGKLKMSIDACAFKGFSYTPSAGRPVVAQTNASSNALVSITNCHYDNEMERPQFNGWPAIGDGYSQLAASARITAAGAIESQWNVASVSRINTGEYVVTYKQPLRSPAVHMTWGKIGPGVTDVYVKSESTTQCVIVTTDAAGSAADRAISFRLHGLLN